MWFYAQSPSRQKPGILVFLAFSFLESLWELEAASSRCELRALLGWVLFDSHLSLRDSRGGGGVCEKGRDLELIVSFVF